MRVRVRREYEYEPQKRAVQWKVFVTFPNEGFDYAYKVAEGIKPLAPVWGTEVGCDLEGKLVFSGYALSLPEARTSAARVKEEFIAFIWRALGIERAAREACEEEEIEL